MHKSCFIIFFVILVKFNFSFAQNVHPSMLGLEVSLKNYKSSSVIPEFEKIDVGLSLSFYKGINEQFDWQFSLSGSFPDSISKSNNYSPGRSLLFQNDLSIRFRIISSSSASLQPFIRGGIGYSLYKSTFSGFTPLGAGIQLKFKEIYFIIHGYYGLPLNTNINPHFHYGIGIAGALNKSKNKPANKQVQINTVEIIKDSDGDGIIDTADACPLVPGLAKFKGCPDTDNDGIQDKVDDCPTVFGLDRYKGCPVPDRDKDGINDENDNCIDTPGVLEFQGCPIPDRDRDGVNDKEDQCIDVFGSISNKGCPVDTSLIQQKLNAYARNIYFENGKFELLPVSYSTLDSVARIMAQNEGIFLSIEGHTDNVGQKTKNDTLSMERANAVFIFLRNKGIKEDRMKTLGYGDNKPVSTNRTFQGRANNRRVELKISIVN